MTENNQSNPAAGSEEELAAAVDEALDAVAQDISD